MRTVSDDLSAFGYEPAEPIVIPYGIQVVEAKDTKTLMPQVVMWVRLSDAGDQVGILMSPTLACAVAAELERWADIASEKHWG